MKKSLLATLPLLALAAVGCSSSGPEGGSVTASNGILVGFVVDAKSGEKLNFFGTANDSDDNNLTDQIYMLVNGSFRTATPCGAGDANTTNTISVNGCYLFQGLPTGIDIPIFIQRSGYHAFSGTAFIDPLASSAVAQSINVCSNSGIGDVGCQAGAFFNSPLFADHPTMYGNIRIFPTGISYDYTVHATVGSRGIPDVTVRCVFNGSQDFDVVGDPGVSNYIDPNNDFNPVVSGTTDANGDVVFAGATLTKGAEYDCFAHADNTVDGAVISYTGGTSFVVGVDGTIVTISLDANGSGLFALSSNIDDPADNGIGVNGPITIILNRDANIVAPDCVAGDLSAPTYDDTSASNAAFAATVDGAGSEQFTVDLTGDTLTLTPIYSTAPTGGDLGYSTTFGGVFLAPASGSDTADIYRINGAYAGVPTNTATANTVTNFGTCATVNTRAGLTGQNLQNATTGTDQSDFAQLN